MKPIALHDPTRRKVQDTVQWDNVTNRDCTIVFTDSPFVGGAKRIQVKAHQKSAELTLDASAARKSYAYTVTPDNGGTPIGPEDEPSISVD
jgi:hypothetical protein